MARDLYTIKLHEKVATLSFSRQKDAEDFEKLLYAAFCTNQSGSWTFVIGTITCGVDWPTWWSHYQIQRQTYLTLRGDSPPLKDLCLAAKALQEEKWRRYDLCSKNGLATCEDVHYPDFFEIEEIVKPQDLDGARELFPEGVFGAYIMACPPNNRLIDIENPFVLDAIWAEQREFFIENKLLVNGDKIPADVVISTASNQSIRAIIKRHGKKALPTRSGNESLLLNISNIDPCALSELRNLSTLRPLWCRMPPPGFSWSQLQAYRWLSRGLGGSLFNMFEGF